MTKEDRGLISDLEIRQIVALVEALDRSSFDTLQLDVGHFRLTLGKVPHPNPPPHAGEGKGGGGAGTELPSSTQAKSVSLSAPAPGIATAQASPAAAAAPTAASNAPAAATQPGEAAPADTVDVRSPIMGLFYCSPDPASPPFVSLGAEVEEGTTVGLIEVMKVFNAVQAGAKGIIVEICVQNAETVEIGQPLFRIRPTTL